MGKFIQSALLNKQIQTLIIDPGMTPPDPPLKTTKLGLITNQPTESADHLVADMTEATGTGYAQSATVVWNAPVREDDGSYTVWSPSVQFQWTADPVSPITITGVMLVDGSTPAKLLGFALFDTPITISRADEAVEVSVCINNGQIVTQSRAISNS